MASRGGRVFKGVDPDQITKLEWVAPHPWVYGQHKLDLVCYLQWKERKHEVQKDGEIGRCRRSGGEEWGMWPKHTVTNSQRNSKIVYIKQQLNNIKYWVCGGDYELHNLLDA